MCRGRSAARVLLTAAALGVVAARAGAQTSPSAQDGAYDHARAPVAEAVRTAVPVTVDGRLDEPVWRTAPPITGLIQQEPNEGAPLSQRTEVRILYDDANIYVGAWLYDEGPVTTRLARRDATVVDSDLFVIFFDSHHDHRTAYRFTTNPSGMKRDEVIDVQRGFGPPSPLGLTGDVSWDPIWEVQTSITDEGWIVEMRIPFSQLRFSADDVQIWGIQVERRINRTGEYGSWPFTPRRERGGVARFGHLEGLADIGDGGRLELLPYSALRMELREVPASAAVDFANPFRSGSDRFGAAGLDLKYGLSSNLTLDATINPDFGQVEMDPAEINLTAFETRFGERRPFFVEGADIFRFGAGGGLNTNLLYSRRIGRSPQGSPPRQAVYTDVPTATTILGAAKLAGRLPGGWSIGILNAVTDRERANYVNADRVTGRTTVEPLSNYFVGRVRRDLNEGRISFGAMATAVNRRFDGNGMDDRLHSAAYAGGVDIGIESPGRMWYLAAEFTPSHVRGSPEAILRTQRSSARYYQRPDARRVRLDPDATSLFGYAGKLTFSKQSGEWRGSVVASAVSPGFEVNDVGFHTVADRRELNISFGHETSRSSRFHLGHGVRFGPTFRWNYDGDIVSSDLAIFGGIRSHGFHMLSGRIARTFATWDDRLTRGGPVARSPGAYSANLTFASDQRQAFVFGLGQNFFRSDAGDLRWGLSPNASLRLSEIYDIRVGPSFMRSRAVAQYVATVPDAAATHTFGHRYVFAPIDQTIVSMQLRLNVTFTPALTLEFYGEPFLGSGQYGSPGELAAPRTFEFVEYGGDVPDLDFNFRSLNANAVLRWEWRPGSTLFLVWQQTRSERLTRIGAPDAEGIGEFVLDRDVRALFGVKPENVFMLKVNYWFNP